MQQMNNYVYKQCNRDLTLPNAVAHIITRIWIQALHTQHNRSSQVVDTQIQHKNNSLMT